MTSSPGLPEPVSVVLENIVDMGTYMADIASTDPLSGALIAVGNLLILFSLGVFGYLTLGALADLVIPDSFSEAPPQH